MCVCARVRACVCLCVCPVPVYGCSVQTEKQMKHRAPSSCPARARALAERSLCARLCTEARLALTYTVLKERNHASSSTPCHSLAHGHPPRGTRCLCMRRNAWLHVLPRDGDGMGAYPRAKTHWPDSQRREHIIGRLLHSCAPAGRPFSKSFAQHRAQVVQSIAQARRRAGPRGWRPHAPSTRTLSKRRMQGLASRPPPLRRAKSLWGRSPPSL